MPKILYVEDNEDNIYMLSRRLKKKNFEVVIATDGADGVEKAKSGETRSNIDGPKSSSNGWLECD